jgi:SpoVK/Ycf46/Vps4 family AAA+-type ATPase
MATTRRLIELFRSIAADDFTSAKDVAAQICQTEEQRGHRSVARQLRGALADKSHNGNGKQSSGLPSSGIAISSGALVRLATDVSMADVVLPSRSGQELREIVLEWRHRGRLHEQAIPPRSRLLFHGPPGCGKSVTARALAKELNLPAYLVRFDAVIGAYLGQTAIHLRQLFHFAEVTPCVLLLDELDALGKRRGNPLDVGELDRIVISLMQELEHSRPAGLIIATSNLAQHLDRALWRRFDLALKFPAPASSTLRRFSERVAKTRRIILPAKVLRRAATARSFADAEAEIVGEARRQVLRKFVEGP